MNTCPGPGCRNASITPFCSITCEVAFNDNPAPEQGTEKEQEEVNEDGQEQKQEPGQDQAEEREEEVNENGG